MPFTFEESTLSGVYIITPRVFGDTRGDFFESYKKSEFCNAGICDEFVQDNQSSSAKGVLRGLHYQVQPYAQGKLVRVLKGAIWDVAVDIRHDSKTFKRWFGIELSATNKKMLYIPPGFAHGFLALSDVEIAYKCTAEYCHEAERSIIWNDPILNIQWPEINGILLSEKDKEAPCFEG